MNADQEKRSEALKQCVSELNSLCYVAKRQLDREDGEQGDPIRAAAWGEARINALKALKSLHEYCGMLAASGDDPHVMIDVAQFAALFTIASTNSPPRQ